MVIALLGGAVGGVLERRLAVRAMSSAATRVLFDEPGPRGRRADPVADRAGAAGRWPRWSALALVPVRRAAGSWPRPSGSRSRSWAVPEFLLDGLRRDDDGDRAGRVVSFPLGCAGAGQALHRAPVRWLCTGYIELFRAIPLLLLIYVFLLALPRLGINLPIFWKLVVPIILVNAAVLAEIFRAGILVGGPRPVRGGGRARAAGRGRDAAVILPQAIRLVIPSLVTQLVALAQGLHARLRGQLPRADEAGDQPHQLHAPAGADYLVVALIYVVVNLLLSRFAEWLERRLGRRGRTKAVDVEAEEDTAHAPRTIVSENPGGRSGTAGSRGCCRPSAS